MENQLSETEIERRLQIVDEHMRAENEHDVDAIMRTFGKEPIFFLNDNIFQGHNGIRSMYETFGFGDAGGFSEIRLETKVPHITADGTVILEAVLHGKHTGEWQGIAPTGREIEIPLCAVIPFDDEGMLAGERVYLDGGLMLRQLGVIS